MYRFDDLPDEMEVEDYLAMMQKSQFNKPRVFVNHVWVNQSQYLRIFTNKDEAKLNAKDASDTLHFASESEAYRYQALRLEESEGLIVNLAVQPEYTLIAIGAYQLTWKADFSYQMIKNDSAITIIEDVKSYRDKSNQWFVANGRTALKMQLFEAWRKHFHPNYRFYLVDGKTGYSEHYHDADFI